MKRVTHLKAMKMIMMPKMKKQLNSLKEVAVLLVLPKFYTKKQHLKYEEKNLPTAKGNLQ
jgi:hypothetical protein